MYLALEQDTFNQDCYKLLIVSIDACLTVHLVGQRVLSEGLDVWSLLTEIFFLNLLKVVARLDENLINCTNWYIKSNSF